MRTIPLPISPGNGEDLFHRFLIRGLSLTSLLFWFSSSVQPNVCNRSLLTAGPRFSNLTSFCCLGGCLSVPMLPKCPHGLLSMPQPVFLFILSEKYPLQLVKIHLVLSIWCNSKQTHTRNLCIDAYCLLGNELFLKRNL